MIRRAVICFAVLSFCAGCATNGLRRDFNDNDPSIAGPTMGGRFPEQGMLSYDGAVGHTERPYADNPEGSAGFSGTGSWMSQNRSAPREGSRGLASETIQETPSATYAEAPGVVLPDKPSYKNGSRATRADFVDENSNDGSLWASDGQTNYYFTKNKIRGVGDIVTVQIDETMVKDAIAEVTRTLTESEREAELVIAQEKLRLRTLGMAEEAEKREKAKESAESAPKSKNKAGEESKAAYAGVEDEAPAVKATVADIDLSKVIPLKAGETMMSEILERFPNGNYKLRGTKRIAYRGSYRLLTMVGIAKGIDITEEDTVNSGKLYEYRLEVIR